MIYKIKSRTNSIQSVFTTADFAIERGITINRKWSDLANAGFRQSALGVESDVGEQTLTKRLSGHIANYPHEMILTVPPRLPGDLIQFINHDAILAISRKFLAKFPDIEHHLNGEGSIAEYPFAFDLSQLDEWLANESNVKKRPELTKVGGHPIEIKWRGENYRVSNTKELIDYRISVFICSNWLPGILDRKASKGSVNHYWTEKTGNEVFNLDSSSVAVFRALPPKGSWFFRVSESPVMLFCTQDFKDFYELHDLSGLQFHPMALNDEC